MPRPEEISQPNDTMKAADEWVAPDLDARRLELALHITRWTADQLACWQRCGEPKCRRVRACQTDDDCPLLPPAPQMTPEENARWRAEMYYAIEARVAELEKAGLDAIHQDS